MQAAAAIRDNSYMDDICDSVHTTQDAQQLTQKIDNMLKKGGFKIKKWLSNKELKENTENQQQQEDIKPLPQCSKDKVLGVV